MITKLIGNFPLTLDPTVHHEKQYLDDHAKTVDELIAEKYLSEGEFILDLGSNIGYTVAHYVKTNPQQITCLEPVPHLFKRLSENVKEYWRSNQPHVRIGLHPVAASNDNTMKFMSLSTSHQQGNTLNQEHVDQFPECFENTELVSVPTIRLDRMSGIIDKITFAKVDVEGHELEVLEGWGEILHSNPPRIMQIEIYPQNFDKVDKILSKVYKYRKQVDVVDNKLVYGQGFNYLYSLEEL